METSESSYILQDNQRAILKLSLTNPPRSRFLEALGKRLLQPKQKNELELELDLSQQVLKLHSPENDWSNSPDYQLLAKLPLDSSAQLLSLAVLAFKAKQFDDGLYAAVELAAQQGAGKFSGKITIIRDLLQSLSNADQQATTAGQILLTAASLGNLNPTIPAELSAAIADRRDQFLANQRRSKPLAFYNWRDDLKQIFQQDRLLQEEIEAASSISALTNVLAGNNDLRNNYQQYLTLISKLTNQLEIPSIGDALLAQSQHQSLPNKIAIFPASRSHESDLIKRLYGNRTIPDNFNLADAMIKHIVDGSIDLSPSPYSGWYDYQTWALEPLANPDRMPEIMHLQLNKHYRTHLHNTFKGILALTRETHVKQLSAALAGGAYWGGEENKKLQIHITPELNLEPLPSYYLRRALGYRFVFELLDQIFGADALTQLHRLKADQHSTIDLATELYQMMLLCYSAYITSSAQLGIQPKMEMQFRGFATINDYVEHFKQWQLTLTEDEDLKQDNRMMVPVFYDVERRKTKVWALLGWAKQYLYISFARPPAVSIKSITGIDPNNIEYKFDSISREVVYPITAEVYVSKLLNRAEFQSHCDRYKTKDAILKNLQ